jgi:hypothetical protein
MAIKLKRPKHSLEKKAKEAFRGYPVGTIAFYGPDDITATKVVAAVIIAKGEEPIEMKTCFSSRGKDVRIDFDLLDGIKDFFKENGVRSVMMAAKIMGCPHQEGIDYPDGGHCPECAFWRHRDRLTGEIIH